MEIAFYVNVEVANLKKSWNRYTKKLNNVFFTDFALYAPYHGRLGS